MDMQFPEPDQPVGPEWWAPLERIADQIRHEPRYQFFSIGDFMLMGKEVCAGRPDVYLYKHSFTRRYLNLDADGRPYAYVAPRRGTGDGRYDEVSDLRDALDHLGLWELPWMKRELEKYRFGLSWDQRWMLHPDADPRSHWASADNVGIGDADECAVCSGEYVLVPASEVVTPPAAPSRPNPHGLRMIEGDDDAP